MTTRRLPGLCLLTVLALAPLIRAEAQTPPPPLPGGPELLKVFLDWPGADPGPVRDEIRFAELVTALDEADVLVRVARATKDGGEVLTISLTGRGRFLGDDNTLTYEPQPGEATEAQARGVASLIKLGLARYVAKTPAAKHVSVKLLDQVAPTAVVDRWDFWVFSLSANAFLMGESQYQNSMFYGSVSANRVTPELKVRASVYGNFSKTRFEFPDTTYKSSTHGYGFSGLVVKSLGGHWSAGAFLNLESSTYSNLKLQAAVSPAVEYDIFPYAESTKRQFRILYRIGPAVTTYNEETIYFKTRETLVQEALSLTYEMTQPWGTVSLSLEGSNYLHDFSKNRLELSGGLSLRIWKGLSFNIDGSYARIRDLLALPRAGASYEEVLLRQKQLATGYSYSFSVGLSYSFGSTRSQVVNPRFGNGGRSISISM